MSIKFHYFVKFYYICDKLRIFLIIQIMDYNEFDGNIEEENFNEEMPNDDINANEKEESGIHHHDSKGDDKTHKLTGMYKNWFLDYASYVILEQNKNCLI